MRPHMMPVPGFVFAWQAEAEHLPLQELQTMVATGLTEFADRLDEITGDQVPRELCPCGCGYPSAMVPDDTLIDMINAAVSVAVHLLGVAQRNPGGIWIVMPPAASVN